MRALVLGAVRQHDGERATRQIQRLDTVGRAADTGQHYAGPATRRPTGFRGGVTLRPRSGRAPAAGD